MQSRLADQATARKLRKKGWTLPEIAEEVKAGKGLVSLWVRDVEISEAGKRRLAQRKSEKPSCLDKGREAWSNQCRDKREKYREEGRVVAQKGEALHALVCGIYWGEGTKSKNEAQIVNSDPHILKKFLEFTAHYFAVSPADICFKVQAYTSSHTEEEIVAHWVQELNLQKATGRKHFFDIFKYASRGVSGRRKGKLPYGVCTITVRKSTHIVQHIYEALEIYGGCILDPSSRKV